MNKSLKKIIASALLMFTVMSSTVTAKEGWTSILNNDKNYPNKVWTIELSKEVNEDTVNENSIFIEDKDGNIVEDINIDVLEDGKIIKVTPEREFRQGEIYYLNVSKWVMSTEGEKLNDNYRMEFAIGDFSSGVFKIMNSEVVDQETINLYFTHPIDESAEIARYYNISSSSGDDILGSYKTMIIKKIPGVDNGLQIKLKEDKLTAGEIYTLNVLPDLRSKYEVQLNREQGDYVFLEGSEKENYNFTTKSIKCIGWNKIEIKFNGYIDENTAKELSNYLVTDTEGNNLNTKKVYVDNALKKIVIETEDYFNKDIEYRLLVRNIRNIYRTEVMRPYSTTFNTENLVEKNLDYTVKAIDSYTIELTFNQEVEGENVLNDGNYYIQIGENPAKLRAEKIYHDDTDKRKVRLYFSKELEKNKDYTISISKNIKGKYGYTNEKTLSKDFKAINKRKNILNIKNANLVGHGKVKLTFNSEIDTQENLNPDNFNLEATQGGNRKVIIGCSHVKFIDNRTLILSFDGMEDEEYYTLTIGKIIDYFGTEVDFSASIVNVEMDIDE